jgi:hypothetical protein
VEIAGVLGALPFVSYVLSLHKSGAATVNIAFRAKTIIRETARSKNLAVSRLRYEDDHPLGSRGF